MPLVVPRSRVEVFFLKVWAHSRGKKKKCTRTGAAFPRFPAIPYELSCIIADLDTQKKQCKCKYSSLCRAALVTTSASAGSLATRS